MNSTEKLYLKVPLGQEAHAIARQFAAEQATPQKGKQTYLNTLAVYAVHSYLKWLQIKSDLSQGDSWHPYRRALFNVADLVLPNIGKLECCPVQPGESAITLPPEAMENRIGYVAVQFSERLDEVELLGIVSAVAISPDSEQISIANLQPLDALFDCLPEVVADAPVSASKKRINLSQWFDNIFRDGWQTLEALQRTQPINLGFSSRSSGMSRETHNNLASSVTSAKLIDLGMQLGDHRVALIVEIVPKTEMEVDISLRVYPASGQIYLPPSLQLIVWDETGIHLEAKARSSDNWIQQGFSATKGENFSVKVALGDVCVTEDFAT